MKPKRKKKVAAIYCNGGVRAKEKIDRQTMDCDCVSALERYPDGILECASGCLGLGSCIAVCRLKAIGLDEHGVAQVNTEKCVGCGLCAKTCPKKLIRMILPQMNIVPRCSNNDNAKDAKSVCERSCIACRICEKNCPTAAISVIDNCAVINEDLCISCGMCAIKCPRGVIIDADGILTVR
ncbi:4Fe-4S binding protein [Lachnospiraceae bacterium ZAX-1]